MSSLFFKKSKEIANDFIQSIVFLDDKAYLKENTAGQGNVNDLDAYEISKLFAKERKICAVYDPETLSDIDDFQFIASKSDVVILDWFIDIKNAVEEGDEEKDADEDDIRGVYTLNIISKLIRDCGGDNLKLVLVYTGETNLQEISEKILQLDPRLSLDNEFLKLDIGNITILVRAKSNTQNGEDNRFVHLPTLRDKVLKYSQLPDFVLEQFTYKTSGLLSNFALTSLSILRTNTSKILGLYNTRLDHAFLEHKSSIPNTDDAESLVLEIFKDSVGDLLYYKNAHKKISKSQVSSWISENLVDETKPIRKADGADVNPSRTIKRNRELLLNLLYSKDKDIQKRFMESLAPFCIGKSQAETYIKYLRFNSIDLFINNNQTIEKDRMVVDFAKITHHKNVFLPRGDKPVLSLGTVLKSSKTSIYYICIQQKCDSVRIEINEARKFLFLPLKVSTTNKFNFITQDGIKLELENKSYFLRTLKFKSNKEGIVVPVKKVGKFYFNQIYTDRRDEKFEWILDLKDLHSQRIVAEYAANLSRVGLDESEWLRKSGNN